MVRVCLHPLSGCQGCDAQQCDYCGSIPGPSLFPKGLAESGATGRAAGVFPSESSGTRHVGGAPQWPQVAALPGIEPPFLILMKANFSYFSLMDYTFGVKIVFLNMF